MIKIVFEQKEYFQMHSGTKDSVNNRVCMTVDNAADALDVIALFADAVQEISVTLAQVDDVQEGAEPDET